MKSFDLDDLDIKTKKYLITKEVKAISITDALRKEKFTEAFDIREISNEDE